ncbi:hypothetical protein SK224_13495 [Microbacterium sp. BG28]|uniref:hypothetical protein n=1 Tax=Microbacterium sp. BG28 TaxID=3097356 RepID=UPI002A599A00|nr:hypothetical protein [Microbacterium sp. BG28]MDY0830142.1 hypothetical protein [Microbacterium sp. BG28]
MALRRRASAAIKTCAALAIIFLITEVVVFALPSPGDPGDADLIYVIGPPTPQRISVAQQLIADEKARGLLVSVSPPGSHDEAMASKMQICSQQSVTCESPRPLTTKGEALMLEDYARTHEVHKVAVITFTPHVARTRYIFARCAPDIDVQVIGVDEHLSIGDWAYQFAYQTTAFAKAAATPCASDDE